MSDGSGPVVSDGSGPVVSDGAGPVVSDGARREAATAAITLALGGGLALLAGSRAWFTVTAARRPPLAPVTADVAGRTVAPAVVGLGVVALAGVVAVLATRATARRGVGAVLALAGVVLIWQALVSAARPGTAQARRLIGDARPGVVFEAGQRVSVSAAAAWPALAVAGGVLVTVGGVLVAVRGGRWRSLSARYDAPAGAARSTPVRDASGSVPARDASGSMPADVSASEPAGDAGRGTATGAGANSTGRGTDADGSPADFPSDLALWQSLERGEDPTTGPRPGGR